MPQGWWESVGAPTGTLFLIGNGRWDVPVVGESFRQAELEHLAGPKSSDGCDVACYAVLVHQDDNPEDAHAIAVSIGGLLVGFLKRADAKAFRKMMKDYGSVMAVCRATIVGGWDRGRSDQGYYGVRLDARWPIRPRWKRGEAP